MGMEKAVFGNGHSLFLSTLAWCPCICGVCPCDPAFVFLWQMLQQKMLMLGNVHTTACIDVSRHVCAVCVVNTYTRLVQGFLSLYSVDHKYLSTHFSNTSCSRTHASFIA